MSRKLTIVLVLSMLAALGAAAVLLVNPGEQMTAAGKRYLATLSDEQKKIGVLAYDSPLRVKWHFIPMKERKGMQVKNMDEKQRRAAFALLRSALSQVGYDKARTVMELESLLKVLQKGPEPVRDSERYYFTVFGEPAEKGKWGLSVEGHHLSLNFVVEDNAVISHTPSFYGGNPNVVNMDKGVGPAQGTYVMEQEEALAFELVNMLDAQQRKVATLAEKAPADIRAAAEAQAPEYKPEGIAASKLNDKQMHKLWAIIHVYAQNQPHVVADARLKEISEAGFDKVYFAWAGADKPGTGHYYRIQGPTFLIEYVNTQPDGAGNPASHPHAVWRDVRGDFGIKR